MPVLIELRLPAGRYHATPWGRHVNEGVPEWPPSPWRLARALVATWLWRCPELPRGTDTPPAHAIAGLAAAPPVFRLPPATRGHTRHFMPWRKKWTPEDPKASTTLVFDTFVALEPDARVRILWPEVTLDPESEAALRLVVERLPYLGRAESLCDARLMTAPGVEPGSDWVTWVDPETGELGPGTPERDALERVPTLVPDASGEPALRWDGWAYGEKRVPLPEPRWNLLAETSLAREQGWSRVPGAREVQYLVPAELYTVRPAARPRPPRRRSRPQVARYALGGAVLPRVLETVYVGEIVRRYLQGIYGRQQDGARSPVFAGRDVATGEPLRDDHRHAFFLPADDDGDGRLDHVSVVAPEGFGDKELAALDALRTIHGPGGTEVGLLLEGVGSQAQFLGTGSMFGPSRVWVSATPYVPTRHHKRRGAKRDTCSPADLPLVTVREDLARLNRPEPVRVLHLPRYAHGSRMSADGRVRGATRSWLEFRRQRVWGGGRRGLHPGAGLLLEFAEPVPGPLALGYGSHFGLGLFAALPDDHG